MSVRVVRSVLAEAACVHQGSLVATAVVRLVKRAARMVVRTSAAITTTVEAVGMSVRVVRFVLAEAVSVHLV